MFNNLFSWYEECRIADFTPSISRIIKTSKGTLRSSNGIERMEVEPKIEALTIDRLIPSIVDNTPLPRDIMITSTIQVRNNRKFTNKWLYHNCLKTTCALINKHYKDKGFTMKETDRSYILGQITAVYCKIEAYDRYIRNISGETNAERLFAAMQTSPNITVMQLSRKVAPYKNDLQKRKPASAHFYNEECKNLIINLGEKINEKRAVSPLFLLGYYEELEKLSKRKDEENEQKN